jgi:hypothetical protein
MREHRVTVQDDRLRDSKGGLEASACRGEVTDARSKISGTFARCLHVAKGIQRRADAPRRTYNFVSKVDGTLQSRLRPYGATTPGVRPAPFSTCERTAGGSIPCVKYPDDGKLHFCATSYEVFKGPHPGRQPEL